MVEHGSKKVASGTPEFIDRIHEDSLDPNFIMLATVSNIDLSDIG